MTDYIRRETVFSLIDKGYLVSNGNYKSVKKFIAEIPAADVVEVVRCKDCCYAPTGTDNGEEQGFGLEWPYKEEYKCPYFCDDGRYSRKPKSDFFCSNGKRKGE